MTLTGDAVKFPLRGPQTGGVTAHRIRTRALVLWPRVRARPYRKSDTDPPSARGKSSFCGSHAALQHQLRVPLTKIRRSHVRYRPVNTRPQGRLRQRRARKLDADQRTMV